MSVEMPSGVMVADMIEGMKFALGAAMAVRRDAIEAIGGIRETADFYSDDFVLGNLVAEAGYEVGSRIIRLATFSPYDPFKGPSATSCAG